MRRRTALATALVLGALVAVGAAGVGLAPGGDLTERWVSDTGRANEVNHHAVGVGPRDEVVLAPVAEVPGAGTPITDDSCALVRLDPADGATRWARGLPADACFTHALTEPAVTDIDGDGSLEAVVASTENALVVHAVDDGAEEWRVALEGYGYGRPTVADLDGDGAREVVVADVDGRVTVATGDGSVVWRRDATAGWTNPAVWVAPVVADVDADGAREVAVGANRGLVVLGPDGRVERRVEGPGTYLAAADADDDPAVELVAAGTGTVRAVDGATGEVEWSRPIEGARLRTVTDGDGDGAREVYLGRPDGTVTALDATTGETEWSTTVASEVVVAPVLGDVDGDGDGAREVVAVTNGGTVVVLGPGGRELAAYERSVPVWTFPTLADLDGDGASEVLVRYGDGRVVALSYEAGGV
jgi:outer membrane protein assembly factor BamB